MNNTPFAFALLLLVLSPAQAQSDIRVTANVGVTAERVTIWHDASAAFPVLGTPTSVLDHVALVGPSLSLSANTALLAPWYVQANVTTTGFVSGTFHDTDYRVGNVLFSDTWSDVYGGKLQGSVKFAPPQLSSFQLGSGQFRPYVLVSAQSTSLTAHGLTCVMACAIGPLPSGQAVIEHAIFAADIGIGGAWHIDKADGQLAIYAELSAGRLGVFDSHLLRADLGPTPNILYEFATLSGLLGFSQSWDISDTLSLNLAGEIQGKYGVGDATFGPKRFAPLGPYPAWLSTFGGKLSAGVTGQF